MRHLNKIMDQLKNNYPNTSWNTNCKLEYTGVNKEFIITTKLSLIGYNKNSTILCYIKPDINKLNYTETKIKSFIDSFIIRNIEDNEKPYLKDKYEKYIGKRIIICIIALNKDEPLIIDFENEDIELDTELKKILNTTLYDYYSIKNKEVVQYYTSFQGNYSDFCDEYNRMNARLFAIVKKQNAEYISRTINGIKYLLEEIDDKEHFIENLNFLERLTKEMKKTIDKYLK
jgi:hydroxylamine reductase (hybrid-cluster protein)